MTSGIAVRWVTMVDPQVGQKDVLTRPPEDPTLSKLESSPRREATCSTVHRDATENTLPDRRWQQVQLHAVTSTGSPVTVTLAWPHRHVAVRCIVGPPLPAVSAPELTFDGHSSRLGLAGHIGPGLLPVRSIRGRLSAVRASARPNPRRAAGAPCALRPTQRRPPPPLRRRWPRKSARRPPRARARR